MATQIRNLREYFHHTPDPRAATPNALDHYYRPGNHVTPPVLLRQHTSSCANEPLVLLGVDDTMSHPMPMCLAYNVDVIGDPNNTGLSYTLVGDLRDDGTHAPSVALSHEVFDDMNNVRVPTHATIEASWTALGANEDYLPYPAADHEEISVRSVCPIPHPYVEAILTAHLSGTLTSRFLIETIYHSIENDPNHLQHYVNFRNYLRAVTTRAAPEVDGTQNPPSVGFVYAGVFGNLRVTARAPVEMARWCPGSRVPNTVQAGMAQLTQDQQAIAASQASLATSLASQGRKTIMDTNPVLCQMAQKVSQQPDATLLQPFFTQLPLVHKTGVTQAFQTAINQGTHTPVIITPQNATDVVGGHWVGLNFHSYDEGISITRVATYAHDPVVVEQLRRNQRTTAILEVYNPQSDTLVDMVLQEAASYISKTPTELQAKILGFGDLLEGLFGNTCELVTCYHRDLSQNAVSICQVITQHYFHKLAESCARVELFIQLQIASIFASLLDGPLPTAAAPRPVPVNPQFTDILSFLRANRLTNLIDIPASMFRDPAQLPDARPRQRDQQDPPLRTPNPGNDSNQQRPDRRPEIGQANWNVPLRAAWTAAGHRGLFSAGMPFHRANTPPRNRARIMRHAPNQADEICPSMACTGQCMNNCRKYHGPLTEPEQAAVAAEGGLQL